MFTFQIVSRYKAGPLWPPAKHFLSISQIFFAGISVTIFTDVAGAAYYCGVAALRTGADSAHVFCDAAAASVIRGYTTELVIHPVLDQEYGMEEVSPAQYSPAQYSPAQYTVCDNALWPGRRLAAQDGLRGGGARPRQEPVNAGQVRTCHV